MLLLKYSTGAGKKLKKVESLYSADPKFFIQMPDGEEAPVFDYKTFPFEIFVDAPTIHKKGKSRDRVEYYNLVTAFDIETTRNPDDDQAWMYIWMWGFEDIGVLIGRTWEELQTAMERIRERIGSNTLVILVHNLSFEFQFLRYDLGHRYRVDDVRQS